MDREQIRKWQELASKFYSKDFWSHIFEDEHTRQFMDGFAGIFQEERPAPERPGTLYPHCDIYRGPDEYMIVLDLPGVRKQDIHLSASGSTLIIRGEVLSPYSRYTHLTKERYYGAFERTIHLPEAIPRNKISARFQSGVLEIRLPRSPGDKEERIHIE